MSAAVQCSNTSITIALAEQQIRDSGIETVNPLGSTCIDPCKLLFCTEEQRDLLFSKPEGTYLPIVASTELVYNAVPTKLGTSCIRTAAGEIARRELSEHLVSRSMFSDPMLTSICRSIGGGYEIDSIWASVVLIVFLSYDPRGRRILAASKLTDMDLQTAFILENYGRSEITRRVRLLETQSGAAKRQKCEQGASGNASALSEIVADNEEEDTKTLGTKRRRSTKTLGASSNSDSHMLIDWWFRALRSTQASVLETLIASSRQTAREAAKSSLKRQAGKNEDVASNKKLNGISVTTAVKSCEELVRLVHHPSRSIPKIVCAKTKWNPKPVIGIMQVPDTSNQNALYACTVPTRTIQPDSQIGIVTLHASGMQEIAMRSSGSSLPCIMERYSRLAEIHTPSARVDLGKGKEKRIRSSIEGFISQETRKPILSAYAGMTRSFINLRMSVPITESMKKSAAGMAKEACNMHKSQTVSHAESSLNLGTACSIENGASNGSYIRPPAAVLATSQNESFRTEPLCTPCSRLGIGIRINELLRRWMIDRTRKNGIAAVLCGLHTIDDIPKDLGLIMDSEPLPMAIVVDFKTRATSETFQTTEPNSMFKTIGVSLNVCMDGAIRVPELVSCTEKLFERRALMITASSQASYISDAGPAMSAQWANCSSASSKKVSCADVNTLLLLSVWDVYAGGLTNVHRNYTNTAYSGAYGSHVDTGITSPGLLANYYKADKRQHGTVSLGQEMADYMCGVASDSHFVAVGDSHYAVSPIQTSGIPHGFVPGLHTVLNDYHESLETYREVSGRSDEPTVDGLFVLPFSAFTQALPPDVESTVDLTIRHAFRKPEESSVVNGRSYLSDTTSEEEAIFVEPMWRRPCQVCSYDNPFSTAYSYADSMFNACSLMSLMIFDIGTRQGITSPELQVAFFHEFICKCVFTDTVPDPETSPSYIWATDFLVLLFGVVYPCSHAIDEEVVPIEVSVLSSRMSTKCKKQEKQGEAPVGVPFSELIRPESLSKIQTLWTKFSKRCSKTCAWTNGLGQLLTLLVTNKGCHDVSAELTSQMRKAVDAIPRSAWLVYSEDGKTPPVHPNPLSECPSPQHVQRTHIDPIFCAMGANLEIEPRGALVGLQPFQMRQVYILMLGSHLKNAKPQVVRNEGGLNLRLSSAADILEMDGSQRSEKAISPLQVDADSDAFGTRDSKLYGSALQRSAWDRNTKLLSPILTRLEPPQHKDRRSRGEWGEAQWLSKFLQDEFEEKKVVHDVESNARNQLERAGKLGVGEFNWAR